MKSQEQNFDLLKLVIFLLSIFGGNVCIWSNPWKSECWSCHPIFDIFQASHTITVEELSRAQFIGKPIIVDSLHLV